MHETSQMSRATRRIRDLAAQLIAYESESGAGASSGVGTPAAFHVSEKLRPQLAMLMGSAGFRALISRALALASAEVPWLRAVHVKADGSLIRFEELGGRLKPEDFLEGKVVLLAEMLGLLVAFIGEELTLRQMREIWPKFPFNAWKFGNGVTNEKAR